VNGEVFYKRRNCTDQTKIEQLLASERTGVLGMTELSEPYLHGFGKGN
jgi:nitroimidazol reductase NimA-like FMN-containing flavoprotein (pyridoxamine 5'-phosphate oxidase superfamily)